jgi:hypothetical protein
LGFTSEKSVLGFTRKKIQFNIYQPIDVIKRRSNLSFHFILPTLLYYPLHVQAFAYAIIPFLTTLKRTVGILSNKTVSFFHFPNTTTQKWCFAVSAVPRTTMARNSVAVAVMHLEQMLLVQFQQFQQFLLLLRLFLLPQIRWIQIR